MNRSLQGISLMLASMLVFDGTSRGQSLPEPGRDKPHVLSLGELRKDSAQVAQTRQANEDAVRNLFSSEQGQKALKSAHLDYQRVDKAVSQLSDEELAKLAQRSRQAQADFAAGRLSNGAIIAIVVVIAATIILVSVFAALSKD
jgi:hypothetical protein